MHDKEAIQMMQRCKEEIRLLRIEIERLKPKAEAYESIAHVLSLLPRPSMGMGDDEERRMKMRLAHEFAEGWFQAVNQKDAALAL